MKGNNNTSTERGQDMTDTRKTGSAQAAKDTVLTYEPEAPKETRGGKEFLFTLPFREALELITYETLAGSYRCRKQVPANEPIPYTLFGESRTTDRVLWIDPLKSAVNAFCFVGRPGCGKTEALKAVMARYPQVILHEDDAVNCVQITHLYSDCVPGCSVSAMLGQFAGALDEALGHDTPEYMDAVAKARSISEKIMLLGQYIEETAVGILIIDDAQNLNARSVTSLLSIADNTGVGLIFSGTDDMEGVIYKDMWTARRVGPCIRADDYCSDRDFFGILATDMLRKQFWDENLKVDTDALDALYEATDGTVGRLSEICDALYEDYLVCGGVPDISAWHIRDIAENI